MSLKNEQERINTQNKIDRLVKRVESLGATTGGDEELREMTMQSLNRTIRQFQDEIAGYQPQPAVGGETTGK